MTTLFLSNKKFFFSFLLLLVVCYGSYAQERVVSGKITDSEGSSLPGGNVVVKGTTQGTVSDISGNYTITVPNTDAVLVYSFIGFKSLERTVGNLDVINVTMQLSVQMLDLNQAVVTAFGIEKQKKSLGFATTTIRASELTAGDNSSAINALQGKVAGLRIRSSNGVGSSQGIVIRGYTSIAGNNQPLFIVDGVPLQNRSYGNLSLDANYNGGSVINSLNTNNVQSVTVLKGASASALYGSRASNGVIIYVTKKGKTSRKIEATYQLGVGFTTILRTPELQNTFGQGWSGQHFLDENGSWGPRFNGRIRKWGRIHVEGEGSSAVRTQKIKPFVAQPTNFRDFFENGYYIRNNFSIGGGLGNSKKSQTTYYFSFGHNKEKGNLPYKKDGYVRYNFGFTGTHQFDYWKDRKIKLYASFSYDPQAIIGVPGGQTLVSVADNLIQIPRDFSIVDYKNLDDPLNGLGYYFSPFGITNPYLVLSKLDNKTDIAQWRGNIRFGINIYDNLNFSYRLGFVRSDRKSVLKFPRLIPPPNTPNASSSSSQFDGKFTVIQETNQEINHNFLLSFNKNLGSQFGIDALIGLSINQRSTSSLNSITSDQKLTSYFSLANTTKPVKTNAYFSLRRLMGLFASVTVDFQDYLFLTLTGRNDWSSTLPVKNNTFFYPSATVSFVFSDLLPENVQDNIISNGKLRVGYGFTGNDAIVYRVNSVYVSGIAGNPFRSTAFPLGGVTAFEHSSRLGNDQLKPEISSEIEAGLEMSFVDYRFGFDVSFYLKNTVNQIYDVPIPRATGYSVQTQNIGTIRNTGMEIAAFAYPIVVGNFSWKIYGNVSFNNGVVVDLAPGLNEGGISFGGFSTMRLKLEKGKAVTLIEGTDVKRAEDGTGRVVVDPVTGIPKQNKELSPLASTQIDYSWGAGMELKYKQWSLSGTIDGQVGGYMYDRTASIGQFTGNTRQTTYNDRKPFIVPNSVTESVSSETGTRVVTYTENVVPVDKEHMDEFYRNGGGFRKNSKGEWVALAKGAYLVPRDYVKIREVALSYTFSKKTMSKFFLHSLRLSLVGRNLALFTPSDNNLIDPESSTFGTDLNGQFGNFSNSALSFSSWGFTLSAGI